jgi:osmotically-inducible protein OsmY
MKNRGMVVALALTLIAVALPVLGQTAKESEIHQLLVDKLGPGAEGIRVTVDRSKAILTGDVPARSIQEIAEEVVLSVDGMSSVDNEVRVTPPIDETLQPRLEREAADAELESRVKKDLYSEIGSRARRIEVEASDGVVSLRGKVPDDARKKIALDTAAKIKGVTQVIDLIKVK